MFLLHNQNKKIYIYIFFSIVHANNKHNNDAKQVKIENLNEILNKCRLKKPNGELSSDLIFNIGRSFSKNSSELCFDVIINHSTNNNVEKLESVVKNLNKLKATIKNSQKETLAELFGEFIAKNDCKIGTDDNSKDGFFKFNFEFNDGEILKKDINSNLTFEFQNEKNELIGTFEVEF